MVHSCACRAEAHEHMARHCPLRIDKPGPGALLWFLRPARLFFLSKAGGTERSYMYGAGHTAPYVCYYCLRLACSDSGLTSRTGYVDGFLPLGVSVVRGSAYVRAQASRLGGWDSRVLAVRQGTRSSRRCRDSRTTPEYPAFPARRRGEENDMSIRRIYNKYKNTLNHCQKHRTTEILHIKSRCFSKRSRRKAFGRTSACWTYFQRISVDEFWRA